MNLFPFFNEDGFSNSYILAEKEHNGPCLIIDPSDFTVEMLHLVESHDYTVEGIFLTHYNRMHTTGLTKLTKIYNPQIYSPRIGEKDHFEITEIGDRKTIATAGMTVNVLNFLGDFGKAVFYRVNGCLFTGDLYLAGDRHEEEEIFTVNHAFIVKNLKKWVSENKQNYKIYPGYGAPTSCRLEFPEIFT